MRRACIALCVLAAVACEASPMRLLMARHRSAAADVGFRVTFLTGTTPTNIVLHASYTGPATAAAALYDAGDGVWRAYTANTISNVTGYVAFKGNWLNAAGGYAYMFKSAFQSAAYTCKFSGALETPTTFTACYREIFFNCTAVTAIEDNPLPILTGATASLMFYYACYNMSGVTGALPAGFMDTSGLTGAPATHMFNNACRLMSGVTGALPTGFMDTSGLTGAPAANMFDSSCYGMSGVTGALPAGFMDTSGLTGAPATYMFNNACRLMSGVTNAYTFTISSNVSFTAANVGTDANVGPLSSAWRGMTLWPGTVTWGTNVLFSAIAPSNRIYSIEGSTNVPGYAGFDANWK